MPPAAPHPVSHTKTPIWVWLVVAATALTMGAGLVAAIAIPSFRIARDAAWDEQAKANLRAAHDAAVILRATSGSFLQATPESLVRTEPGLEYTTGESTASDEVSVHPLDQRITLAVRSQSGTCWVIDDDATVLGSGGFRTGRLPDGSHCSASSGTAGLIEEDR